jgi:hypothetical protein
MTERFDGRPGVRFELDVRAERGAAALRVGAALITVFAGAWLLMLPYSAPRYFAVAGLAFAALWLWRAFRMHRKDRDPQAHYLELRPEALCLCEGGEERIVPWQEVESVAIDEDRLQVVVTRKDSPALLLEPQYRGLGLRAMADAVQDALTQSRQTDLGRQAVHG